MKRKINQPDYKFYVINNKNKIISGWEYKEDAQDFKDERWDKSSLKIYTKTKCKQIGLNPDDNNSWGNEEIFENILKENYERLFNTKLTEEFNEEKLSLVILSHLSDIQVLSSNNEIKSKIGFIKYLILKKISSLGIKINPSEMWEEFIAKYPKYKNIDDTSNDDDFLSNLNKNIR